MRRLVLASSSPYRRALLERLQVPFDVVRPEVDEAVSPGEAPTDYVERLARRKAEASSGTYADALIIGSDQCAVLDGHILGKPQSRERARTQLADCAGRAVVFHTGLCVLDTRTNEAQIAEVPYTVHFRRLEPAAIEAYLDREAPYDCAGSFKAEGLGVALFERMEGEDPTALIGLPLIRLSAMLRRAGLDVLAP
ncbi:MAG: Maf family nucleotide pyrophosphatase [Chromatiales bacterium]